MNHRNRLLSRIVVPGWFANAFGWESIPFNGGTSLSLRRAWESLETFDTLPTPIARALGRATRFCCCHTILLWLSEALAQA